MTPGTTMGGLVDLFLPKRCVQCGAAGSWLCEPCAGRLRVLPRERCPRCAAPLRRASAFAETARPGVSALAAAAAARRPCPECAGRQLAFVGAAAAFAYEGPARALVTACKFRSLRSLAGEMAHLSGPAFAAACGAFGGANPSPAGHGGEPATCLVTWVPGHRRRSLERGFNQAELRARALARAAGLPYDALLRRVRHGARQSGLSRVARAANAQGAFALRDDANRVLKRLKRVVVVDDVYTTGETLNRCAEVLAQADLEPHVFTFARAIRAASSQASLDHAVQKERCR